MRDRDRRALFAGSFIVVPGLLFGLVVRPYWRALSTLETRAASERVLLSRELRLLEDAKHFGTRFDAAGNALLSIAPHLFNGTDPLASAATLSDYVGAKATEHRVFVQQSEAQAGDSIGSGIRSLTVELRAVSDLEGIVSFLDELERGEKLVRIDRIVVTQPQSSGAGMPAASEVLGVSATLIGYALEMPDSAAKNGRAEASATERGE